MTSYDYPDDTKHTQDEVSKLSTFEFDPGGTIVIRDDDKAKPTIESSERRNADLAGNWEPIPTFGQWTSLGRRDR